MNQQQWTRYISFPVIFFFIYFLSGILVSVVSVPSSTNETFILGTYRGHLPNDLVNAIAWLNRVQNPTSCNGTRFSVVKCGHKAGFASQFQMTAITWLKHMALHDYSMPALIVGHLVGYSEGKDCDHANNDWTCYFLPMSTYQQELLSTGRRIEVSSDVIKDMNIEPSRLIPPPFRHQGMAWWWGVVQAYLFRPQPSVEAYIDSQIKVMARRANSGGGFPFGSYPAVSLAGLHIRHGDKGSDGFKLHTLEAQVDAARRSRECVVPLQTTNDNRCRLRRTHASNGSSNGTTSGSSSHNHNVMRFFVASDDKQVIHAALSKSYLVTRIGVSQETVDKGMAPTLDDKDSRLNKDNIGYNASIEIIADIYFLAHCTTLVGTASSQGVSWCNQPYPNQL